MAPSGTSALKGEGTIQNLGLDLQREDLRVGGGGAEGRHKGHLGHVRVGGDAKVIR